VAVDALSPTRALRKPWRLDGRVLAGLFLAAVVFAGSLAVWQRSNDSRPVVVAARDLPAGATLTASDVTVARVRLDDEMYAAAVPGDEAASLVGRQLAAPVYARQIVGRPQVSTRSAIAPDQVALTIPVTTESAVGGRVRPGDDVQVLLTTNKGKPESRTTVLLPRATVYDVGYGARAAVVATNDAPDRGSARPLTSVTLVLSQQQSVALAHARHNGELDVALLPPGR
jgi:Flp pilus assembly protein CpaB